MNLMFRPAVVTIAVFLLAASSAFSQTDNNAMSRTVTDLSQAPIVVASVCGESVTIDNGKSDIGYKTYIGDDGSLKVNWKPLTNGTGYGSVTGRFFRFVDVEPYNFSGDPDGFNYSAVRMMKLIAPGDVMYRVKANYQASWTKSGGLVVHQDNYQVVCR